MVDKKEKQYITENAHLMDEWNWKRNADTTPFQYTLNSHNKVWWVCIKGHEWQASIAHRNNGRGCPYCSGKKVLNGYNDLQTINPKLATEWNYEKNGDFRPDSITSNSCKKAWWRCSEGHEWHATIASRSRGHGCPYCSGRFAIKGKNDLQTINPVLVCEWDYEKNGNLKPENAKANSQKKVWWKCRKGHEWQASISHRNKGRGCPVCNSESKNSFPEYALRYYLVQNGLQVIQAYREKGYELDIFIPSKAVGIEYDGYFWHKNKEAQDLAKNSKCKSDGIKLYRIREGLLPLNDTSIDYVVERYQGDLGIRLKEVLSEIIEHPVDVNLDRDFIAIENLRYRIRKGNSLLTSNPELEIEWDYAKNGNLKPENIAPNSCKKVWWKCCEGHEWQAMIASRHKGHGCPYCSGRFAVKGENDLQSVNPSLASEWNYEKNGSFKPDAFTANSGKKVWWRCSKGHEWQAVIGSRNKGTGCPYCSGNKVLKGYNDLQTVNPALAEEWDYEKNGELRPDGFTPNSDKRVWWKCDKGHEWQTTIGHRNNGRGCPRCSKKRSRIVNTADEAFVADKGE